MEKTKRAHRSMRRKLTPEDEQLLSAFDRQRAAALRALLGGSTMALAGRAAGVTRQCVWLWRQVDKDFDAACVEAMDRGTDRAEETLAKCALMAEDDPRYVGALIFLLKNRRPKVWRDAHDLHHAGGDGEPIRVEIRRAGVELCPVNGLPLESGTHERVPVRRVADGEQVDDSAGANVIGAAATAAGSAEEAAGDPTPTGGSAPPATCEPGDPEGAPRVGETLPNHG